ncbi:MAG: uroporphyrinogen decarboxylase family protein [Candidatus Bipolaricaulota bacterium]|nr:hypothetical protein [Candidatus Bipolaricaulota bacterium]
MLPKERFEAVVNGQKPDRFPMWFGGDPETLDNIGDYLGTNDHDKTLEALGIDFRTFRPEYTGPELRTYDDGSWETFWGIRRKGEYYGQAVTHPLQNVESLEDVKRYDWPRQENWSVDHMKDQITEYSDYAIIGGSWSPFFHSATDLLGFETYLTSMVTSPEIVKEVTNRCFRFYYVLSKRAFEKAGSDIDLFFIGNDFGGQDGLLFSPQLWSKFIRGPLQKFVDLAHSYDAKFALHSCGDVSEIIPDLIEMGVDILNPIQITAGGMNPSKLVQEHDDSLVFFGGIDEKEVLRQGSRAEVKEETRRIIDLLGTYNKYIVAPSHDYLLPDIPAENIASMYEEARNCLI